MEEKLLTLGYDALAILVPALCVILIEFIRRKLGLERVKQIQAELKTKQDLASMAIKFVEQGYKELHGQDKYDHAAKWLATQARARGIKVSSAEIKGLIESAIRGVKDEFGEQWPNATKTQE